MIKDGSWALIESPIPNAPEGKYISQIPSPNNLLTISSALKSIGIFNIKFFQFLKDRVPNIVQADNIVYNMGEATCMDYLYNYSLQYLNVLKNYNPDSRIYLTGYHAWLHKEMFHQFILTSPKNFENDIIEKNNYVEWHNDWSINDWDWMKINVNSKSKGVRATFRSSRGCPYKCKMCPVNIVYSDNKGTIKYSVKWIMEEISTLYYQYNIRQIGFLDDNLFYNINWGKDLLINIINSKFKGLSLTFEEGLDVPTALNEDLIKLLKLAGFTHIKLGVESLNKDTLIYINKPYRNPEMAIEAIKLLQKNKFNPTCFICIGFPTDTEESIRKDIQKFVELGVKLRVQILWKYPTIDFTEKGITNKLLRQLQKEAMDATGSSSWRRKQVL